MPPREPVCRFPAEIVASLDGSAGVHPKDFSQAKMALLRSVDRLCMEDGSQRLGAIVYGSDVTGRANLMGNDRELKRQIGSFRQPFGASNTAAALKDMDNIFHFAARPGVPKFGVVMTTGNSQNAAATARQAAQAKASGVRLLSLGLGARQNFRELAALASHPNLVFQVPPFFPKDLALYNVLKWICWLAGHNYPPPQTTTRGPPTWSSTPRATPPTPTPGGNTTPRTPTPGTPTPTPTAPPTPSVQPPRKPDLCEGSRVKEGVEYNPHPTDCDKHVQCVDNGDGTWQVSIVQCPHGLLWDQSRLICNFPDQVNCDICLDGGVTSFPASAAAGCRAFWECVDGVAVGRCCPEGWAYSYLAGGCLPDPACMDDCNLPVNNGTVGVCDKRAVSGLPSIYEQQVIGVGWVRMPCPAGTQYSAAKCGCVITKGDNSSIFDCKPEIYLPFTMGTEDRSGNSYFIHNDGVKVNNGVAYFDGNAVLRIPRFANSDFGTTFLMDIRYRRDGGGGGGGQGSAGSSSGASGSGSRLAMSKQALVSNGDCGKEGSLFVSLGGDAVNFGVRTRNGVVSAVSLPSQWDWQNAVFRLDDRKLTGTVNGKTDSAYVGDIVERSNCALQIGRGTGFDNFKGYIDELTVYLCEN